MDFEVHYDDPDELLRDVDAQLAKGGFLVRGDPPDGLALFSTARLRLRWRGRQVTLEGTVIQVIPGIGVALGVSVTPALEALVDAARARAGGRTSGPGPAPDAHVRVREAGRAEKIRMARYGSRDERMLIMRGTDRSLHRFVLENPGLTLDEVRSLAGMSTLSADVLDALSKRSEWAARPEVAVALVRNPKTPVPVALRLLAHVSMNDLRQIAKSSALRMPILQAARKRVIA